MSDRRIAVSPLPFLPTVAASPSGVRPVAARTRLLLEGPVLPTLLRLSTPNVLNLLAIAGMITFDGLFLGRLGADVLAGASLAFPFVMLIHTQQRAAWGAVSLPQSPVHSAPASATSPTRSPFTLLFSPSDLRRYSRQCC